MEAGKLNRRVRIERRAGDDDRDPDTGQPLDTWVEVMTVRCNVKMLTGKETLRADSDVGEATASIRIRFRTGIDNGMRAVVVRTVGGLEVIDGVFNILKALPDFDTRDHTDLACTEGANDG
ncbi:phage head closure protein [Paraburkholderia bannensis]|uniref:phage head closure protein n=1 Tax=Paraburkholderia bannensis TaxID=765414 RepID=UPI0005A98CC7|nr:phage head closure protein [Paraburkholderia bannensis]